MEYHMPYGKEQISITIPDSVKQVELRIPPHPIVKYPEKLLLSTFENPIQTNPLNLLVQNNNPNSIVIVVDDQTRKFPHKSILGPLLKYLKSCGIQDSSITIIVATGVHRKPTKTQLDYLFGSKILKKYRFKWNDQENGEFIDFGVTSRGTPVKINSIYAQADLKILVTDVTLHYFAGYGGDRKSIFPGIAAAESINKNHALVMQGIYPGQIVDNPIHDDMMEAAQLVGADFVINVCLDSEGNILDIKSGALKLAFLEAVQNYQPTCSVSIKNQADLLIISAGGYPFDGNYQQSMKAIMQCQNAIKPGGKILYFLKGDDGIGIPAFKKYLDTFPTSKSMLDFTQTHEYQQGMHNAYYYRKFTEENQVYYKTDLPRKYVCEVLNVEYVENIQDSINVLLRNVKLVYIIRHGTKLMVKHEK